MFYLIYILLECMLLGFYNAYLMQDNRTPDTDPGDAAIKQKWHATGALIHLSNAALGWYVGGWAFALLVLALFWGPFAGIVHRVGLQQPFFFVGTTSWDDRVQRWAYAKINTRRFSLEQASGLLKTLSLAVSLALVILFGKFR